MSFADWQAVILNAVGRVRPFAVADLIINNVLTGTFDDELRFNGVSARLRAGRSR
jgi:hypothetical protein